MAELIAAGAAVGVASSIITFCDVGWRIVKRIKDYRDAVKDIPATLKHIDAQLPVLIEKVEELKLSNVEDVGSSTALGKAVLSCEKQVKLLDQLIDRMLPGPADSRSTRTKKAVSSVWRENELKKAWSEMDQYKSTFIFLFTNVQNTRQLPYRAKKTYFLVPFSRNPDFVGRQHEVEHLRRLVSGHGTHCRVGLVGLGGIGLKEERHVFWVHASNRSRFEQGYRDIATLVDLPGASDPKTDILELVSSWLKQCSGKWLLVVDNADDAELFTARRQSPDADCGLSQYLPQTSNGSIIITSRDRTAALKLVDGPNLITVYAMSDKEAEALALAKLPGAPQLLDLIRELDNIPLAIVQAAAYIREADLTVQEYLSLYRGGNAAQEKLLTREFEDLRRDKEIPNSVIGTWMASFKLIQRQNPQAADILSLMSVLDRQGIPKTLIVDMIDDPVDLATALGKLSAFSLISIDQSRTTYELHRLVQKATVEWLSSQGELLNWKQRGLQKLCNAFPDGEHENWLICERLAPHSRVVLDYDFAEREDRLSCALLRFNMAWYFWRRGEYRRAKAEAQASYNVRVDLLGSDDLEVARSLNQLGLVGLWDGLPAESEPMQLQAVKLFTNLLGPEHPSTLASMANLALVYSDMARWDEAQELQLKELEICMRVLGPEHRSTLTSMANLALTYRNQGRWAEAEELQTKELEICSRVLGPEHPETLTSMANLGTTYRKIGRWDEAEQLQRKELETCTRVLGLDHPDTMVSMGNLASTYRRLGRLAETESLELQVFQTRKKVLGSEHPDTVMSMWNLAHTYKAQGKMGQAIELQQQVVDLHHKVLSAGHPYAQRSAMDLQQWMQSLESLE